MRNTKDIEKLVIFCEGSDMIDTECVVTDPL